MFAHRLFEYYNPAFMCFCSALFYTLSLLHISLKLKIYITQRWKKKQEWMSDTHMHNQIEIETLKIVDTNNPVWDEKYNWWQWSNDFIKNLKKKLYA
jgi:hypothetical protein